MISFRSRPTDDSYFYLYRISYMWYCPLGSVISFAVGLFVSWISNLISRGDSEELDPNLFNPIKAARMRARRLKSGKDAQSNITLDSIH